MNMDESWDTIEAFLQRRRATDKKDKRKKKKATNTMMMLQDADWDLLTDDEVQQLAGLSKLSCTMLHVVFTNRLIGTDGKHRFTGIHRCLHSSSTLHVGRVVVFTRSTVFAPSCSKIVATIFRGLSIIITGAPLGIR